MEFFASVFTVVAIVITIVKYVPKFAKEKKITSMSSHMMTGLTGYQK
jgi:hypothetical protein